MEYVDAYWNKLAVAAQQVLGLCTEELVRKFESTGPKVNEFNMPGHGYALSRAICLYLNYFDEIDDEAIVARVESYTEDAQFLCIYANGELTIETRTQLLDVMRRKYVGAFSIFAPLDNLSWAVVVYFENLDTNGLVKFRFVDAEVDGLMRNRGLARLLAIAENGGVGEPEFPFHHF